MPESFRHNPARILIIVDLPAPFNPNNPNKDPFGITKFTSVKAKTSCFFLSMKVLFSFFVSIVLLIFFSLNSNIIFLMLI